MSEYYFIHSYSSAVSTRIPDCHGLTEGCKVEHKGLVTHRFAPQDWKDAIQMAISKGKNKSVKQCLSAPRWGTRSHSE